MAKNKEWINKIDEESLKKLIKNVKILDKVPLRADKKIVGLIKNNKEKVEYRPNLFEKIFYSNKIKLAIVAIILFLIFIPQVYLLLIKSYYNKIIKKANIYSVLEVNGNVVLTRNNNSIIPKINQTIIKNDNIKTNLNSDIKIKMGTNSEIKIYENSEIRTLDLKKTAKDEINRLFMKIGKIECLVNLPSKDSIYEIKTESSLISVKGTKFILQVLENQDIILDVYEGIVRISNYTKTSKFLKKIRKKDKDIYQAFLMMEDDKILVYPNDSIYLSFNEIKNFNKDFIQLLYDSYDLINKKDFFNEKEKNKILKSIYEIKLRRNIIFQKRKIINILKNALEKEKNNKVLVEQEKEEEQEEKELFTINKLPYNANVLLTEIDTAITNDNDNLYISSDSNKSIYCLDRNNGNLKWTFKDDRLKKITSPIIPFNNELIIGSPNAIFILNNDSKLLSIKEILKGPSFWPYPHESNNKLFIPTFKNIYQFNGESLELLENFPDTLGQLYISANSDNLYCVDLNEQNIKVYNFINNKIIWISDKFQYRAFISPVISELHIFVADSKENIYKFDNQFKSTKPKTLNINTGVITNLVLKNDSLFFIANNGYFYKLNIDLFNSAKKIFKVDTNPDLDNYFTKKLMISGNEIFFCSDSGKLFYYNILNNEALLININNNDNIISLIGTPVNIGESIYVIDNNSNIYKLNKNL